MNSFNLIRIWNVNKNISFHLCWNKSLSRWSPVNKSLLHTNTSHNKCYILHSLEHNDLQFHLKSPYSNPPYAGEEDGFYPGLSSSHGLKWTLVIWLQWRITTISLSSHWLQPTAMNTLIQKSDVLDKDLDDRSRLEIGSIIRLF